VNPHDILSVMGEKQLQHYLVNEIQEVYRLQGVDISDKHIEVIVRQMLRRVRIKDIGDTNFLIDEQVEKRVFEEENERAMAGGGRPAVGFAVAQRASGTARRRADRPRGGRGRIGDRDRAGGDRV